jgi:hypothetical protein
MPGSWDYSKIKTPANIAALKRTLLFLKENIDLLQGASGSLALGITNTTAYYGDLGKVAYDHSQLTALSDPHGSISLLRDGVDPSANTLKKLYDLIISIGTLVGDFNAGSGLLPTTGSGLSNQIDKGDSWHITVSGTLPVGLTPIRDVKPGDILVARINNPVVGSDFYVIENTTLQATSTAIGTVKLYNDLLASNTDGTVTQAAIVAGLLNKQDVLVSGTNLATINGASLLANINLLLVTFAGGTFTGDINLADNVLQRAEIKDYSETVATPAIAALELVINLEQANVFNVVHNSNINTITILNPPVSGKSGHFTLYITQDAVGGRTLAFPANVKFPDGTAPTLTTTALKKNKLVFDTLDGGGTWDCQLIGKNYG